MPPFAANPMFHQDQPPLAQREQLLLVLVLASGLLYALLWLRRGSANKLPIPILGRRGALLCYFVTSLLVTYPLIWHLGTRVVGDAESDVWKHIWGWWWVKQALLQRGVFPLHADIINAPFGGSLYCIDPLNALLSVPLQLFLPLVVVFNLMVLLHLTLGAFAAYLLAEEITGSAAAALPAGVAYGFSPYVMAYAVASGVTETLNLAWMPLALLYWIRTLREPTWRHSLRFSIGAFLTVFGSFYYGAFLGVMLLALSLGGGLQWLLGTVHATPAERAARVRSGTDVLVHCGGGLLLAAAMAALPLLAFFDTLHSADSIIPSYVLERAQPGGKYIGLVAQNYASLLSFLAAGKENLVVTYTVDRLSRTSYLGLVVLLWSAVGLTMRGWARVAAALAALFLVLSLGPFLVLTPSLHLSSPVSPPYLLLYWLLPLFSDIAIPYRFVLPATLMLAVTASCGVWRLIRAQPAAVGQMLALAVSANMLAEFVLASPAPYPAPLADARIPAFYQEISQAGSCAILELPPTRWNTELSPGEYFLYQTVAGDAVPYTISGLPYQSLLASAATKQFCYPHFLPPLGTPPPPAAASRAWLSANHFRFVVVHQDFLDPADLTVVRGLLAHMLGQDAPRVYPRDRLLVYEVPVQPRGDPHAGCRNGTTGFQVPRGTRRVAIEEHSND